MTGPEHYREAEALLRQAAEGDDGADYERYLLAAAQAHATLALAAAAAYQAERDYCGDESRSAGDRSAAEWTRALSGSAL